MDLFQESSGISTTGEGLGIGGHVTVVHKDATGNVLSYQQYDNVIVNEGLNCVTEYLFASANTTCASTSQTEQFDAIGLLGTAPDVQIEDNAASGITRLTGSGLDPVQATTRGIDVAASGTGTSQGSSTTGMQHTFTKTGAGSVTVGGATLQTLANDAIFAAKAFTGGDLTLNENDTLQIGRAHRPRSEEHTQLDRKSTPP